MNILVLNVGSTTLKASLVDPGTGVEGHARIVDRIGQPGGDAPDHAAAVAAVLAEWSGQTIDAIGHRIVQGGHHFSRATIVDAEAIQQLASLDTLAPLHNPSARGVVEMLSRTHSGTPQVMVFDTAYFATLPRAAAQYAIPDAYFSRHHIRRYGAHGTSHQYVTEKAIGHLRSRAGHLEAALRLKIISLHLGGGASVTASIDGVAVETSMGLTPLEGLVMATRCGDIDASVVTHLMRQFKLSIDDIDRLLNRQSGLLGLCGDGDMRTVLRRSADGDGDAQNAIAIYLHRIRKIVGGYVAVLGGVDAVVFTAGVGERSAEIRRRIINDLTYLGVALDTDRNAAAGDRITEVQTSSSSIKVMVIPTNESLAIANQVHQCLTASEQKPRD